MRCIVVVSLLALTASCKSETPVAPPIVTEAPVCSADVWVPQVVELGKRAAEGQSVVTRDGCSLFDGKLLARGYPLGDDEVRKALTLTKDCLPVLKTAGGEYSFVKTPEGLRISRVKSVTDEALLKEQQEAGTALDTAILQAARCPRADRRLDDDQDASVAMAYALAASALQQALVAVDGKSRGPDAATSDALNKVCATVKRPKVLLKDQLGDADAIKRTLTGQVDVEPFAAMAVVMASSFTVFNRAAKEMKVNDPGLNHVRPAAVAVLSQPPQNNLEGVCSVWTMAETVMQAAAAPVKKR